MTRVPVKHCTMTVGREPRFFAEVGDTVSVREADGRMAAAKLEQINGERVTVKYLHSDETAEVAASELGGVFLN